MACGRCLGQGKPTTSPPLSRNTRHGPIYNDWAYCYYYYYCCLGMTATELFKIRVRKLRKCLNLSMARCMCGVVLRRRSKLHRVECCRHTYMLSRCPLIEVGLTTHCMCWYSDSEMDTLSIRSRRRASYLSLIDCMFLCCTIDVQVGGLLGYGAVLYDPGHSHPGAST